MYLAKLSAVGVVVVKASPKSKRSRRRYRMSRRRTDFPDPRLAMTARVPWIGSWREKLYFIMAVSISCAGVLFVSAVSASYFGFDSAFLSLRTSKKAFSFFLCLNRNLKL